MQHTTMQMCSVCVCACVLVCARVEVCEAPFCVRLSVFVKSFEKICLVIACTRRTRAGRLRGRRVGGGKCVVGVGGRLAGHGAPTC